MKVLSHYQLLADMFSYPSARLAGSEKTWNRIVSDYDPMLLRKLNPFIKHLKSTKLSFQQEYYVSTFDVQPVCTLDIGYVLFGDDYRRGEFLVHIKKEQLKAGIDCGSELPDHLPNILILIPKLTDPSLAEELIYSLLIPALHEMISKFSEDSNLYKGLLEILVRIMEIDFPVSEFERFSLKPEKSTVSQKSGQKIQL